MEESIRIKAPLTESDVRRLRAGDRVLISGVIYTARDAAHKRLIEALKAGAELPFDLDGQIIYYVGPCPAKPGQAFLRPHHQRADGHLHPRSFGEGASGHDR